MTTDCGFHVFVRIRWKSICPSCFDAEAERAGEQAALTLCQIQALSLE
jgi:hypothetical protein